MSRMNEQSSKKIGNGIGKSFKNKLSPKKISARSGKIGINKPKKNT
jgi:hypothetical protein